MHYLIGQLGHAFVILAFISALGGVYAYAQSVYAKQGNQDWLKLARGLAIGHFLGVLATVTTLYIILGNKYYEYFYAWSHASNDLPTNYLISSFWEGQEGSFLLWLFWDAVLLGIVMMIHKKWEKEVLLVGLAVQAFLVCMILGVVVAEVKIGSSPFQLLREAQSQAPIFKMNPEYIPEDGAGLNLLLQNYWMVIHPPTLFLGFAFTLIPFSFLVAGLLRRDYTGWVKPAFAWTSLGAGILGTGIIMGAIWAYETLNFGGYWNWDPVENAVFVPWLVQVASLHAFVMVTRKGKGLKAALVLVIMTFVLILYSTFLTRSGILGESSVHSFTDLGLYNQLVAFISLFTLGAFALVLWRWKDMPKTKEEKVSFYSREFWLSMGIAALSLCAFQVIHFTSMPVYNAISEAFGGDLKLAAPSDQVQFYSKWQLWFAMAIAILSGTGQYFFWQKMSPKKLWEAMSIPLLLTLVLTGILIPLTKVGDPKYIFMLFAGIYAFFSNAFSLVRLGKKQPKLLGGSLAHLGVAMMLVGILYSSAYDNIVSLNNTGKLYHSDAPDDFNRDHLLLWQGKETSVKGYTYLFKGPHLMDEQNGNYVPTADLITLPEKRQAVTIRPVKMGMEQIYGTGDTIPYNPDNLFCRIEVAKTSGQDFTLFPRIQRNAQMASSGNYVVSPDIKKFIGKDLYTYVSEFTSLVSDEKEWEMAEPISATLGDTFVVNDYVAVLHKVKRVNKVPELSLEAGDAAVEAQILLLGEYMVDTLKPLFVIKDKKVGRISAENGAYGLRMTLDNINPQEQTFQFGVERTQKSFIIIHAIEKPLINLLWLGTVVLVIGFGFSTYRRFTEKGK